jgi:mRNA-degrading endonuclease YafQ of YafQ-DinJ toxin-antitoxin module
MSRIRAINEISFPRDSRFGHSPSRSHASYLAALPPTRVAPAHACSGFRASKMFVIFNQNPFDSRLRSHKIQKLSARYGRVIYAAEIEADLRVVFYVQGDTVVTLDIGSHALYR